MDTTSDLNAEMFLTSLKLACVLCGEITMMILTGLLISNVLLLSLIKKLIKAQLLMTLRLRKRLPSKRWAHLLKFFISSLEGVTSRMDLCCCRYGSPREMTTTQIVMMMVMVMITQGLLMIKTVVIQMIQMFQFNLNYSTDSFAS
eukprot:m.270775 g.270775  ORF g.270775 m.270775 type:complete len:145 (+) comp40544_c2_seq13:1095-1529(+)